MASGPAGPSPRARSSVSRWLASTRSLGSLTTPGCTSAIVAVRVTGAGPVSAKASGPAATTAAATTAAAARAVHRGEASTTTMATFAATSTKLTSQTPPTAASASTAGCRHWLAPSTAHGPPRACHDRSHSPSSQQLGTTISAPRARVTVSGGRSSAQADSPNGVCRTPNTAATSSTPGPISGASQYMAATMYPLPSHQPRTAASRADGARRMISRPGTSANHATTDRSGAGKASVGTAPATQRRPPGRAPPGQGHHGPSQTHKSIVGLNVLFGELPGHVQALTRCLSQQYL